MAELLLVLITLDLLDNRKFGPQLLSDLGTDEEVYQEFFHLLALIRDSVFQMA